MRRMLPLLLFAAHLFVLSQAQAQSREESEVRSLLDRSIRAANSKDDKLLRQNLAEHSASGGPYFPPFAMSLASTAEVEAMVNQNQGQVTSRSYEATSPITVRADKNLAWAAYAWRAAFTYKDGTSHSYVGRSTATFVREGKNWRFAHWHNSIVAPPPLTAAVRDAETQKVIETERDAWEAVKNRQPASLADYFADDVTVFVEGSAYRLSGKANVQRSVAALIENTELRSYEMLEPQVALLGDTALLTYYFTESGVAGGKEFSSAGKITKVLAKRDGAWRVLHEHRSVNR